MRESKRTGHTKNRKLDKIKLLFLTAGEPEVQEYDPLERKKLM